MRCCFLYLERNGRETDVLIDRLMNPRTPMDDETPHTLSGWHLSYFQTILTSKITPLILTSYATKSVVVFVVVVVVSFCLRWKCREEDAHIAWLMNLQPPWMVKPHTPTRWHSSSLGKILTSNVFPSILPFYGTKALLTSSLMDTLPGLFEKVFDQKKIHLNSAISMQPNGLFFSWGY